VNKAVQVRNYTSGAFNQFKTAARFFLFTIARVKYPCPLTPLNWGFLPLFGSAASRRESPRCQLIATEAAGHK